MKMKMRRRCSWGSWGRSREKERLRGRVSSEKMTLGLLLSVHVVVHVQPLHKINTFTTTTTNTIITKHHITVWMATRSKVIVARGSRCYRRRCWAPVLFVIVLIVLLHHLKIVVGSVVDSEFLSLCGSGRLLYSSDALLVCGVLSLCIVGSRTTVLTIDYTCLCLFFLNLLLVVIPSVFFTTPYANTGDTIRKAPKTFLFFFPYFHYSFRRCFHTLSDKVNDSQCTLVILRFV